MTFSTSPEEYEILILGSGEAGKYLAWTLSKNGKKTALIERKWVGGSCPNIACLPSKNIIHSAKVASYFSRSREFGVSEVGYHIDMQAVRERKRKMVVGLVDIHLDFFRSSGVELILGSGKFSGPKTIEVSLPDGGVRLLRGERVIISTGSRAKMDDIPGLAEASPLTHIEALELDTIPDHLLVLGGGYVGLEFAQAMRRFGSQVTIIEQNDRLVHREDRDVSDVLHEVFTREGIVVATQMKVSRIEGKSGVAVRVHGLCNGIESVLEGSHLMIASGRLPNTEGIGLESAGIETTSGGFVKVNERLEATAPGVFGVGDCAGSPHFTHIAYDDYRIVRDNLAGGNRVTTGRQVPFCLFTDPEFARVGLSETEAIEKGVTYRLAKLPMDFVMRARTVSETAGFMKALVHSQSDQILGFTMIGTGAGEVMATVQVAINAGYPYTALRDTIFTHPTLSEGLISLFSAVSSPAA